MDWDSQHFLTDSTMPHSFAQVGAALALLEFFESLHMVRDVREELERHAANLPSLRRFLDAFPDSNLHDLDDGLKGEVAQIQLAISEPGRHPNEDIGEIATVLFAHDHDDGKYVVITDDNFGKKLARSRGLSQVTTQHLILEMCRRCVIEDSLGKRVWQQATPRAGWSRFDSELEAARAAST